MNMKPEGKQPKLRKTISPSSPHAGKIQKFIDSVRVVSKNLQKQPEVAGVDKTFKIWALEKPGNVAIPYLFSSLNTAIFNDCQLRRSMVLMLCSGALQSADWI